MKKESIIFVFSFFLITAGLWAGGWNNTLMGCKALALGGAFVGVADDPSAIFYNPAGLVFQRIIERENPHQTQSQKGLIDRLLLFPTLQSDCPCLFSL